MSSSPTPYSRPIWEAVPGCLGEGLQAQPLPGHPGPSHLFLLLVISMAAQEASSGLSPQVQQPEGNLWAHSSFLPDSFGLAHPWLYFMPIEI